MVRGIHIVLVVAEGELLRQAVAGEIGTDDGDVRGRAGLTAAQQFCTRAGLLRQDLPHQRDGGTGLDLLPPAGDGHQQKQQQERPGRTSASLGNHILKSA